jgi:hypothetical protein
VTKSAPDGLTVLFYLFDSFTYVPQLFKRLPYDPPRDPGADHADRAYAAGDGVAGRRIDLLAAPTREGQRRPELRNPGVVLAPIRTRLPRRSPA